MESETPAEPATEVTAETPVTAPAPVPEPAPAPAPVSAHRETAHERHTRELEQSLEVLEETVERRLVRFLKVAVPLLVAFLLAAAGLYVLGGKLRDRSEARRVARAMRRASRVQTSS